MPGTRREFWQAKIEHNRFNDGNALQQLRESEWRVLIIWECSVKGRQRLPVGEVINTTVEWLQSDDGYTQIRGEPRETL